MKTVPFLFNLKLIGVINVYVKCKDEVKVYDRSSLDTFIL